MYDLLPIPVAGGIPSKGAENVVSKEDIFEYVSPNFGHHFRCQCYARRVVSSRDVYHIFKTATGLGIKLRITWE